MDLAAGAEGVPATGHRQARSDIPLVLSAPGEGVVTAAEEGREVADLDPGHRLQSGRRRLDHLRHAEFLGSQARIGIRGKVTGETAIRRANVQQSGRRDDMGPREYIVLTSPLRARFTAAGRRPEASAITILLPVLKSEYGMNPVFLVEDVVPTRHRLIIVVTGHVRAIDEVIVQRALQPATRLRKV